MYVRVLSYLWNFKSFQPEISYVDRSHNLEVRYTRTVTKYFILIELMPLVRVADRGIYHTCIIFIFTDSQPYKCCNKSYVERSSFEAHQRAHHDKKKIECEKCKETFTRKSALNRHSINHKKTENKEFTCNVCKRGFMRRDELVDHVKGVHEKVQRFSCPTCFKRYAWGTSLHRHISNSHK